MPYLRTSKGKIIFVSDSEIKERLAMVETTQELLALSDDAFNKALDAHREEGIMDKCTLSDTELIEKSKAWISKLCETGGKGWCLRVPVDFNHDPEILFHELCTRLATA